MKLLFCLTYKSINNYVMIDMEFQVSYSKYYFNTIYIYRINAAPVLATI